MTENVDTQPVHVKVSLADIYKILLDLQDDVGDMKPAVNGYSDHETRIRKLESLVWRAAGASMVLGALFGFWTGQGSWKLDIFLPMARKVIHIVSDDIDGTEDASTVTFALNGKTYEIDLAADNQAKLEAALAPFIRAGRSVRSPFKATGTRDKVPTPEIRAWGRTLSEADQKILFPSDRGRLSKEALAAYNDVHGTTY